MMMWKKKRGNGNRKIAFYSLNFSASKLALSQAWIGHREYREISQWAGLFVWAEWAPLGSKTFGFVFVWPIEIKEIT